MPISPNAASVFEKEHGCFNQAYDGGAKVQTGAGGSRN